MNYDGFKISKESVDKIFPREDSPLKDISIEKIDFKNIDLLGYESPIKTLIERVNSQIKWEEQNAVLEELRRIGVEVDKAELIKALRYDRGQYEEGYRRGYSAGVNTDKWISVEDRLPERNGGYLAHCDIEGQSLVCVLYYSKVGGFNEGTVTHWMPLPEPPKER